MSFLTIKKLCGNAISEIQYGYTPFPAYSSLFLAENVQYNFLPMTGIKPQTSGIGSDRSTNWATTTAANLFFKWAKPASFLFIFVLFSTQWQYSTKFDYKKRRWCAWDSNPGRQNGRRRRIHWPHIFFDHFFHRMSGWNFHGNAEQRRLSSWKLPMPIFHSLSLMSNPFSPYLSIPFIVC